MVTPSAGQIVILPFPFSDLSQTKVRPAICLANAGRGDWVLCQVTSNSYGDPAAIEFDAADFVSGSLIAGSAARAGKLFTANSGLMIRAIAELNGLAFNRVLSAVIGVFQKHIRS